MDGNVQMDGWKCRDGWIDGWYESIETAENE